MLTDDEILSIIASELSDSDYGYNTSTGYTLEEPLSYYLGLPDGKEIPGRSTVVSTDVADCIEWIMPQIMKSFTQNNEIVVFDPNFEGDEYQAELESQYVYEVLMKQNDGFIIIHQFVKDALMQRNGLLKVYYTDTEIVKSVDYTGITEDQLGVLLNSEGVEIVEQSEYIDENQTRMKQQEIQMTLQQIQQQMQQNPQAAQQMMPQIQQLQQELQKPVILYDVKLSVTRKRGQIYVESIAPENFRVNSQHNAINLDKARFSAHVESKSISDIIVEYGLSKEDAEQLSEGIDDYDDEYRFAMQGENVSYDDETMDMSQRKVEVSECYMFIDIDETGIAKYMKIAVSGGDTPDRVLSKEEIECNPCISTTAILMSHVFQGLSVYDRLKQIQEQKTTLWRNMLDNMYLQNNQRNVIVEGQVNIDDLLVSRPGGIIRAKRLDSITPLVTPQLGQDAYQMMEYLDIVRAGRVGVDPEGGATPQNIGDRVGSEGLERILTAKEELVGLMIRVIAETGIKPLCIKIRDLTVKHVDSVVDFKFRSQWQKIKPSEWIDRTNCTVRVGTGTGNTQSKLAAIGQVIAMQEKVLQQPSQALVTPKQIFTAFDDFCKLTGLNGASRYFIDPESQEGQGIAQQKAQQAQQESQQMQQIQMALAKAQIDMGKAELEKSKAQLFSAQAKAQADHAKNQLQMSKQSYETEIDLLKQQLEEAKAIAGSVQEDARIKLEYDKLEASTALELTRIEAEKEMEQNKNYQQNKGTTGGSIS